MDSEPLSTLERPQGAEQPIVADPSGAGDAEPRSWVQRVRARLLTSDLEEESFSPSEDMPTPLWVEAQPVAVAQRPPPRRPCS